MANAALAITAGLIAGVLKADTEVEVDVLYLEEPDPVPDFKGRRTDPAYGRKKTHPTSFRKKQ